MKYYSTRNYQNVVSASEAIVKGIAEDGGLYIPESFPKLELNEIYNKTYTQTASIVLKKFLTDYQPSFIDKAVEESYGEAFHGKAGETVSVAPGMSILELWHGPTCAFKDYALQLMPRLLCEGKRNIGHSERTLILVATSGDTGKAALDGYKNLEGIDIAVFYPDDGTSKIQRLQMATQEGTNVSVWAVKGNFDDAQRGVKTVFTDKQIAEELAKQNTCLSSANSINWGRLVPQIVYYFYSYAQLVGSKTIQAGDKVNFCVPTGNFGDILAGYYAKQMGLPVHRFICASNDNNVLTEFFNTGRYNARRQFYKTTSPSMDILVSSNLERLLSHILNSDEQTALLMNSLNKNGCYTVSDSCLKTIQQDFAAGYATEEQVDETIREVFTQRHYLCDTHTAVAVKVAEDYRKQSDDETPVIVLSTASPFKFPGSVLKALGKDVPEDDFDAIDKLETVTGCTAPDSILGLKQKSVRFDRVIEPQLIADVALGTI